MDGHASDLEGPHGRPRGGGRCCGSAHLPGRRRPARDRRAQRGGAARGDRNDALQARARLHHQRRARWPVQSDRGRRRAAARADPGRHLHLLRPLRLPALARLPGRLHARHAAAPDRPLRAQPRAADRAGLLGRDGRLPDLGPRLARRGPRRPARRLRLRPELPLHTGRGHPPGLDAGHRGRLLRPDPDRRRDRPRPATPGTGQPLTAPVSGARSRRARVRGQPRAQGPRRPARRQHLQPRPVPFRLPARRRARRGGAFRCSLVSRAPGRAPLGLVGARGGRGAADRQPLRPRGQPRASPDAGLARLRRAAGGPAHPAVGHRGLLAAARQPADPLGGRTLLRHLPDPPRG